MEPGINFPQQIEVETPGQTKTRVKKKQSKTNEVLKTRAKKSDGKASGRNFKNQKHLDIMSFNADAEIKFVELVRVLIEENNGNPVNITEVYREVAYELDVSPQTVKRYLMKHSARRAELRVFGKAVMLNPNYAPAEEENEEE